MIQALRTIILLYVWITRALLIEFSTTAPAKSELCTRDRFSLIKRIRNFDTLKFSLSLSSLTDLSILLPSDWLHERPIKD